MEKIYQINIKKSSKICALQIQHNENRKVTPVGLHLHLSLLSQAANSYGAHLVDVWIPFLKDGLEKVSDKKDNVNNLYEI